MNYSEELAEDRFGIVQRLRAARSSNRAAHAYLLHGDNAELREKMARLICATLLCSCPDLSRAPCGECESCVKIPRGSFPDLHILEPASKSRKILIGERDEPDTLRHFQDRFYLSSSAASGKKAGIILDAECLMVQAQNAFLKTLEEPPKGTLFVLATGNPEALLPTVRSRCQTLLALSNRVAYVFNGSDLVFAALRRISFDGVRNFLDVESCAAKLLAAAAGLQGEAEATIKDKWKDRLAQAKKLESKTAGKMVEEKYKAAIQAEYLRLRQYFTESVYVWMAQVYQLASGVPSAELGNPEFFPEPPPKKLDWRKAAADLRAAERLLQTVNRIGVDESLAIRAFCAAALPAQPPDQRRRQ